MQCSAIILNNDDLIVLHIFLISFKLLFSSGTLVTITIAFNFADIERITIDKSLANKIVNETIHCGNFLFFYMQLLLCCHQRGARGLPIW